MKKETSTEEKIKILIDKMRPFLLNDGGDLEFIKYENNIVYVKLLGACKDCSLLDYTLKDGIEEMIISEIFKCIEAIEGATNVVVENKGKLITFELNNESFKIDLIQRRKPKA